MSFDLTINSLVNGPVISHISAQQQKDLDLVYAVGTGNAHQVGELIKAGADIHQVGMEGKNLLHHATELGYLEVCKALVEAGLDINEFTLSPQDALLKPLVFNSPCMDQDYIDKIQSNGMKMTALNFAVLNRRTNIAEWLLSLGAKVDTLDFTRRTPLFYAFFDENREIVSLLITAGADINIKAEEEDSKTYLYTFSIMGNENALKMILECKPSLDDPDLLCSLCLMGKTSIVKLLLEAGMDPCQSNAKGNTPLHDATFFEDLELVSLLLDHGAKVNARNKKGETVLHNAVGYNKDSVIPLLLKAGADPIALDDSFNTPLSYHYATSKKRKSNYGLIEKADNGFSKAYASLRLIGARFKLKDPMYECLNFRFTFPFVLGSLKEYLSQWDSPVLRDALALLENSYVHLKNPFWFIDQVKQKKPLVMPLTWPGHGVLFGVFDNIVVRANRGRGSGEYTGIIVDEITIPEKKDDQDYRQAKIEEAIHILSSLNPSHEEWFENNDRIKEYNAEREAKAIQFFNKGIEELLGLKIIGTITQHDQPTGTCGLIAIQEGLRVSTIFTSMGPNEDIKKAVTEAVNKGLPEYRKWALFDRHYGYELLDRIFKDPRISSIVSLEELKSQIRNYFSTIKQKRIVLRALSMDFKPVLGRLFTLGIDINGSFDGWTPLCWAAFKGRLDWCKFLVKNGADMNGKSEQGAYPLELAVSKKHLKVIDFFLSKRADLERLKLDPEDIFEVPEVLEVFKKHCPGIDGQRQT